MNFQQVQKRFCIFVSVCFFALLSIVQVAFGKASPCRVNLRDGDVVLLNALVLDPSAESVIPGNVIVREKMIYAITSTKCSLRSSSRDVQVVDVNNGYVIPGLIDLHYHSFGENPSPLKEEHVHQKDNPGDIVMGYRMLFSGVTTYLDLMASDNRQLLSYREMQRQGKLEHPNIFMTGGAFTVDKGLAHSGVTKNSVIPIDIGRKNGSVGDDGKEDHNFALNEAEKRKIKILFQKHVREFSPDAIKIVYDHNLNRPKGANDVVRMNPFIMRELIKNAVESGIPAVVHVGTWQDARQVYQAASDYHAPPGMVAAAHIPHGDVDSSTLSYLKDKQALFVTTLSVYMDLGHLADQKEAAQTLRRPLLYATTLAENIAAYFRYSDFNEFVQPWVDWSIAMVKEGYYPRTIKALLSNNIRLATGTDVMWEGVFYGFSVHREMELMVRFGATPMQALKAATVEAGKFLGVKRGRLRPGYFADLVVLKESPLERITNTQKIDYVMINGEFVDREEMCAQGKLKSSNCSSAIYKQK